MFVWVTGPYSNAQSVTEIVNIFQLFLEWNLSNRLQQKQTITLSNIRVNEWKLGTVDQR